MSTPLHNELAAALVELREQQTRITEAVAKVAEASTTVAADDRMVEATVDGQGKLVGLKFHGRRWRDLAPGELAARLVDVVAKAQDQAAAATASVFAGVMPNGMSFTKDSADDLISELDAMFDTAVANGTPQGGTAVSRLAVDPEALRNGGVNIRATVDLAVDICNQLFIAADTNRGAGGTGEIGEKFDSGYRPGEEQALKFLRLLQKSLGETGSRTITTAGVFRETDEDANAAVPP